MTPMEALPVPAAPDPLPPPVSPAAVAWRRLRGHRMALASLVLLALYALLCLGAPLLPLHPYAEQVLAHENLPPSFQPAGITLLATREAELRQLLAAEQRPASPRERTQLAGLARAVASDPVHRRIYLLGTDALGRDLLSRLL